jgi:hypothetical protein
VSSCRFLGVNSIGLICPLNPLGDLDSMYHGVVWGPSACFSPIFTHNFSMESCCP